MLANAVDQVWICCLTLRVRQQAGSYGVGGMPEFSLSARLLYSLVELVQTHSPLVAVRFAGGGILEGAVVGKAACGFAIDVVKR